MKKYRLNDLHEIRSDLSVLIDKLDYLMADMECKSHAKANSISIQSALDTLGIFIHDLDDSVNGAENRKIEAHIEHIRSLSR